MLVKMAWRNLFRHKKRTLLTLITMAVGIMLAILGEGLNRGMYIQVKDTYIKTDIGQYKIYAKGYYEERDINEPLEFPISNTKELERTLKGISYEERIVYPGSITNSTDELNITFIAVDREREESIFNRSGYMAEGNFLKNPDEIVVGSEVADLLNLEVGMEITLLGRTFDKALNAYDKRIGGIIKTGNPLLDSRIVFVPLKFGKEFIDADIVNDIVIGQALHPRKLKELKKFDIDIIPYDRELREINQINRVRRRVFGIISISILVMAGLSIANTMLMSMLERKKEIGIMMANGMSRRNILKLFLLEGCLSGFLGGLIGFAIGSSIVIYYEEVGLALFNFGDTGINLPISDRLFFGYSFPVSMFFFGVGMTFAVIASYYPAYKATHMEPVEVIREE